MKLGPITIGGRRDGSGYQHSTASVVITPEDTDSVEDCMARATDILKDAFAAAEAGVENRGAVRTAPVAAPAPPKLAATSKAPPLQSFPATEVGKLAKTIVSKAAPTAKATEATKAPPVAAPAAVSAKASTMTNEEKLKYRIDLWRKSLAEREISEADCLRACGASKPEDLEQLNKPINREQMGVFLDDVAKILKGSDDVPM